MVKVENIYENDESAVGSVTSFLKIKAIILHMRRFSSIFYERGKVSVSLNQYAPLFLQSFQGVTFKLYTTLQHMLPEPRIKYITELTCFSHCGPASVPISTTTFGTL